MHNLKFKAHGKESEVLLFGHKICELDWLYLGQELTVFDKRMKRNLTLSLYQVSIDGDIYLFGANEIDSGEWIFYTKS